MDTSYVLDVSVVVKWFAKEKEDDLKQAQKLFRDIQNGNVSAYAPDFLLIELSNALLVGKQIGPTKTKSACSLLLETAIRFLPTTPELLFSAIEETHTGSLTIYDALYVALAKSRNAHVLTADTKMQKLTKTAVPLSQYR